MLQTSICVVLVGRFSTIFSCVVVVGGFSTTLKFRRVKVNL